MTLRLAESSAAVKTLYLCLQTFYKEPNEQFNHLAGIQDYHDCEAAGEWASVFNYLYLEFGRMLHPPKLKCATISYHDRPMPAVLHNAFRAPDGSEAVVLANGTAEKQTATFQWKGREHIIELRSGEAKLIR
ncbi:MAG: hypothetical protein NTX50_03990 [Candidatus Sumerlaeota bacterium]|nr:hypothetical protein [Candidatus Sumerlaeota bacterium]